MNKKKKQPKLKTAKQEGEFWEKSSVVDYISDLEEVDNLFALSPELSEKIKERTKKRAISIRLANWEIELTKKIAKTKNIPYQRLMREWIDVGIKKNLR